MERAGAMTEPKSFASLSPSLLARKGGARPAMRPQLLPMQQFNEATARQIDDLGWNDMGMNEDGLNDGGFYDEASIEGAPAEVGRIGPGEVIAFNPEAASMPGSAVPEVVRQQERIALHVSDTVPVAPVRRSALAGGRRAAFTLRLDADRHLHLRLASTLSNRSAQQLVTEALDRMLSELTEVAALAAQVGKRK